MFPQAISEMVVYLANITSLSVDDIPIKRLSERAKNKFERLKINAPQKAVQTAVADLILSYAKKQFDIDSDVCENEHGKPFFADSGMCFSITHSDEIVSVSLSEYNHGIDLEKLRRVDEKTVRAVLSPFQYLDYLKADDAEKDKMFVRIFTEKESYVKYLGTGFTGKPSSIEPQDVKFLTKYLFRESDVYCLTVCTKVEEEFRFQPVNIREIFDFG